MEIPGRALVGRSRTCALQLTDRAASGEHALICWKGDHWELRDLGSRNGTWLDGQRLEPADRPTLTAGAALAFGDPLHPWILQSVDPPAALALPEDGGAPARAEGGLLTLPDAEQPELTVHEAAPGRWVAERGEQSWPVAADDVVEAGGRRWRLSLGSALGSTWQANEALAVADAAFRFAVSPDEEYVELEVSGAGQQRTFKGRAHLYLLLTLARRRLADQEAGASEANAGWVYHDELVRMLRVQEAQIYVQVYRARKQLGEAGVEGAGQIVERRASTRELRFGGRRIALAGL